MMEPSKVCTQCHLPKPLSEFYLERGKPRNPCKKCKYKNVQAYRQRQGPKGANSYVTGI